MLQTIYVFLLGLLTTAFVELGIASFYKAPAPPEYQPNDPTQTPEEIRDSNKVVYAQRMEHAARAETYYGNVAMITMVFVILQLVIGLVFAKQIGPLADGFLLGGIFSLAYGVGVCFHQSNAGKRFLVVTTAFVIALVLGYIKFVSHQ